MKQQSKFWLYKIINKKNWKIYIGYTTKKNPILRWNSHKSESKNSKHKSYYRFLCRAIRKYGEENFEFIPIREYKSFDELKTAEIEYIAWFDTFNQNFGYNMTKGGDGVIGQKRTEEHKIAASKRMSLNVGEKNYFYGKTHTEETKKIISEATKIAVKNGSYDESNKNRRRFNPDEEKVVINTYLSGKFTKNQLSIKFKISLVALNKLFKRNNIKTIIQKPTKEHIENNKLSRLKTQKETNEARKIKSQKNKDELSIKILPLHKKGMLQKEIAKTFGISQTSVSRILIYNGIRTK